jgi:uncharacterized protein YndB with AHSA1/START domain
MSNNNKPIIVEQIFNKSISEVWNAITELKQMKQWFFENIESFKPEVGFETQFNVKAESRDFLHIWKITEVVPMKKIVYDWRYEGIVGAGIIIFELFAKENQTTLRLTNQGLNSFPKDIQEFTRESCIEGWNYFIKNRLKEYLK